MDRKTAWALAMLASSMVFFSVASAADDGELMEMRDAVVAVGGDWASIEMFLATLSPEERELVIATYPERIAELEEIRRAIEESGADWTAGLNPVSILPPELRPGTGRFSVSDEAGGVPRETVTVGPGEGGLATLELPDSWDWRDVDGINWTTPIKDEGLCGASWAFAPLGAIEARVKLAADNPNLVPDFSEQYMLSCCPFGNCSEANLEGVADWIVCQGTVDEACFPYAEDDEIPCSESCFDRDSRKYKSEGWYWVCGNWYTADADSIKREVFSGGPVSSFMEVYTDFWYYNESDIYEQTYGDYQGDLLVDIVGWGNESGKDYWICKNSWGTGWGDQGWFKIKMGEVSIGTRTMGYVPKIRGKVLFYEGHSPFYGYNLGANYSEWGNRLASNGYLVHSSSTAPLTAALLSCYDVVIISNPGEGFSAAELAAIKEFVGRGRVIASGDGDLFANEHIYKQDNERMAVEYVDWLATGEGGGLLIMGGEYVEWLGPIGTGAGTGTETETETETDGPEPLIGNDNATQVSDLFGLHINTDFVSDPLRYDGEKGHVILGPEDDVLVINGSSLSISKDAFALARTTPSGYVTAAGGAVPEALPQEADVEVAVTPEEIPLSVMSAEEIPPEEMPPAGDLSPGGELAGPAIAPEEELGMEVSSEPVPMAGLSFTGPIVIAAIDFGRKGEDTVGVFRDGAWHLDYDNDGVPDKILGYGVPTDVPITGDWNGDGKDTVGLFRDGSWNLDDDNDGIPDITFGFGTSSFIPISGDWDGDGKDSAGLFRDGGFHLDYDNDGIPDKIFGFGTSSFVPLSGDWDGDGKDSAGLFREGGFHLDYDNDGIADKIVGFGVGTDIPITGDWNGDGKDTVGVFRNGTWFLDFDNDGVADKVITYGQSGYLPLSGDWYKN
jgi:C1A family cysteine protease